MRDWKCAASAIHHSTFLIQHSSLARSVSHLGPCGVGTLGHQFEADRRSTVWTFCADRLFVDDVIVILLEPHQLKALRTASHLRCHGLPLTLRLAAYLGSERLI